jgi:hypothetical protein
MGILVALALLAVAASLGAAAFFMLRGPQEGKARNNMARALALRIGISVLLFVCILLAWKLGYIQPTGIRPGQ